ncbi:MAG: GNAT family N-acetyltransferase [Candidatus Scalinduaceae bacterium]
MRYIFFFNTPNSINWLSPKWIKLRYSSFIRFIICRLARIGIRIQPYYIYLEGLFNGNLSHFESGFDEYDVGFLGPQDMEKVSSLPGLNWSKEQLMLWLKKGNKCFGVKYRGDLVALTWCQSDLFDFFIYQYPLKEDEANICHAYTLETYRGKGLAPYVRYQCYKELAKLGKIKLYSASDYFNFPAIRFKKKLHAKKLELCLFISLFKKFQFKLPLKRYSEETLKYSRNIHTKLIPES